MPIRFEGHTARFEAACSIDEAIPLAEWLCAVAEPRLDLGGCTALHTALLQVLLASGRPIAVPPDDAFLKSWVLPLLVKP
ncbi:hypothetical protein D3869_24015 (plasmid) [Azospirillum brasilense]|uniref:Uncharacterized protein n=1 Tax=Azospirillum brasilense TaxID=192 RepID=A0A4D8RCN3_AZOBR|nr:hypothetical protein [Azospirillum brasilense]QCO18323.1 hypothetical protein D3869_24015 [Azospirillum brasilense]